MDQASDVFKSNEDQDLIASLRTAGTGGQRERIDELAVKFQEHSEQIQEVSSFRYNVVNFLKNVHKRHPISCTLGQGMGSLLEIQHLIDILPQFL